MISHRTSHFRALNAMLLFLIGMAFSASIVGAFWNLNNSPEKISSGAGFSVEETYIVLSREGELNRQYIKSP